MNNQSVRNLLLDYYIALSDTQDFDHVDELKIMVKHSYISIFPDFKNVVNKSQRYACLKKLVSEYGFSNDIT